MKSSAQTIPLKFSQTLIVLQAVERGCFYEVEKMVLQYEQEQASASLQHSALQVFYQPLGESESSQTSEGSGETGDSGNFSQDEAEPNSSNICEEKRNSSEYVGDASNIVKISLHVSSWIAATFLKHSTQPVMQVKQVCTFSISGYAAHQETEERPKTRVSQSNDKNTFK